MKNKSVLLATILALLSFTTGCRLNYENVAMFRGNLERTGFYSNTSSQLPSGQLNWKFKPEYECYSSPAILQGAIYINCGGGYLYAVSTSSGEEYWVFKRDKWGGSSPTISNGVIYVGSLDGYVYAINENGSEKWRFKTGDVVISSPAVSNGIAYIGSHDGYLYALDIDTGQEVWKFKTQGVEKPFSLSAAPEYDMLGAIFSSPAISNGVVYFGSYDGNLYALDINSGQEKWTYKTGDSISSSPAISENVIYFGSRDGYLYVLDKNGKLKWKFSTRIDQTNSFTSVSSPAIANGIVYFASNDLSDRSDNNYLFAVDIKSGAMKWKLKTALAPYTDPTFSNGVVYFADETGSAFAINAETGQVKWKFNVESAITSDIVIISDTVYFCSKDGYLYSLR